MTKTLMMFFVFLLLIGLNSLDGSEASASEPTQAGRGLVTTVHDHKPVEGTIRSWSQEKLILNGDAPADISIADVVSLKTGRSTSSRLGGTSLLFLTNGDRIVARAASVSEDVLTASGKLGGNMAVDFKIPLELVAAVVFELPPAKADRERVLADLKTLPSGADFVLLANGDRTQGEFETLDGAFVELKGTTGLLKLDRSRVRAVRFNPELTSIPKLGPRRFVMTFVDGTHLTADRVELKDDSLTLELPSRQTIQVPISSLVACQQFGSRISSLADREPAAVEFVPYLAAKWTLVRNANVLHNPMSLRGTEFVTGLGMHSRMAVSYNIGPNDREFRATIGIDDMANGSGSARFVVELDGKPVWSSDELTSNSPAIAIPPTKLDGAKRLTLIVDFGQQADVSDYANWCDAIVISNEK